MYVYIFLVIYNSILPYLCISASINISIGLTGAVATTHTQVDYSIADVVAKAEMGYLFGPTRRECQRT